MLQYDRRGLGREVLKDIDAVIHIRQVDLPRMFARLYQIFLRQGRNELVLALLKTHAGMRYFRTQ